ncbi:MAG: UDP-3-O-(3-hydroxymyristoyl)glucosamine N-acyltransferase [Desulfarculales bacterium]|jgi:UDP-3-O-[3-hydroxymyristoyl] glucosamine N-acyltransferase|nr:UDP-3-O-(3-hydroxymyristoyl)glucosamine N-acyltransferase [Desulfarculales bacterium]
MEISLGKLAAFLGGSLEGGSPDYLVSGLKGLEEAGPADISFLANPRYAGLLPATGAGVVLVGKDQAVPEGLAVIKVDNPYLAYAKILTLAAAKPYQATGVHPTAVIEASARLGKDVSIYPFVYIGHNAEIGDRVILHPGVTVGDNAKIGDGSLLYPKVTVYHDCSVGRRCILHAGAVIGADGFGFVPGESNFKIPQLGIVQIDDEVEIGAGTTVDRATTGKTWIKQGAKIDNQVMIAHNCVVGEHTMIAAQSGISGSSKVGRHVIMGGQVGIGGHVEIGDDVQIGAKSGLISSVAGGARIQGSPPLPVKQYLKTILLVNRLPELFERLKQVEKKLRQ